MTKDELVEKVARELWGELNRQNPVLGFGYKDADNDLTILDGAYDLDKAVAVAIRLIVEECARVADDQDDVVLAVESIRSLLPEGA